MKITKTELSQIIKEEAQRFITIQKLKSEKVKIEKMLNESYVEEELEEELGEGLKDVGRNIMKGAKSVIAPTSAAKDVTKEWISNQESNLVNSAKTDETNFKRLEAMFKNFLKSEEIGGGSMHLYLTPFYNEMGELGKKAAEQRSKGFVSKHSIDIGKGGLSESEIRRIAREEAVKTGKLKQLQERAENISRKLKNL
jgi:hypothetical protein